MAVLNETRERIAFAAAGVPLAIGDGIEFLRVRALALAALAVVAGGLALVLTSAGEPQAAPQLEASAPASETTFTAATYVSEPGFSLSLPTGWDRAKTPRGSAFTAASGDGLAETTLWVERDRNLGFGAFVKQSMESLDEIGTGARISDQVRGRALESRIAELRAEVPLDGGLTAPYRVTLRAAGPFRYYLATSVQPGAPDRLLADAEVLANSFRPAVAIDGVR